MRCTYFRKIYSKQNALPYFHGIYSKQNALPYFHGIYSKQNALHIPGRLYIFCSRPQGMFLSHLS